MRTLLPCAVLFLATAILVAGCDPSPDADTPAAPAASAASAAGLTLVGHTDLGGAGLNGTVAVVGQTAVVAAGITPAAGLHTHFYNPYPCPAVAAKIVDLSDPARPRVVATIPVEAGVAASDVAARAVETEAFTGHLAAIALARCNADGNAIARGVVYYDLTDPAAPVLLGRYHADVEDPAATPGCGAAPDGDPNQCAASQHSVVLVQREDGRVLSLSTEPAASASNFASGDLRVVEVTDPRRPAERGSFPPAGEPVFSYNGCRPFIGGHHASATADGRTALVAMFDGGLATVDLTNPTAPAEHARLDYGKARRTEGNAGYVTAMTVGGRTLALVSEEDWIGTEHRLRIDAPAAVGGTYLACPATFTLFDPGDSLQVYRRPDAELAAEVAYVGRGCPANPGWGTNEADPYLSDPAGKLALIDRQRQDTQPALTEGSGCSLVERVKRAQAAGAVGAILMQTNPTAPEAFSPDGDVDYVRIPFAMIDKTAGDSLRTAACPAMDSAGACMDGAALRGALTDAPGQWGGLRVIDITNPAAPTDVATFRTPNATAFPPPDLGVYAPGRARAHAGRAYVAWHADGLRVLDLSGTAPTEVGHFVPEDRPDPTGTLPGKAHVVGVDLLGGDGATPHIVITDLHGGLYVLAPGS